MRNQVFIVATLTLGLHSMPVTADPQKIAYPDGYRAWHHVQSTVNLPGFTPESAMGIQHVYANKLALEGLKSGQYADGAIFVLDRFKAAEESNKTMQEGDRKLLAIMLRDAVRFKDTGGWGFEGFKGGDREQRVVQDGGKNCFSCHAPMADSQFVLSKLRD